MFRYKINNLRDIPGLATLLADYFLALFPVFTLSTNFPIIAITLRSNLSALSSAWPSKPIARRILFPWYSTVYKVVSGS